MAEQQGPARGGHPATVRVRVKGGYEPAVVHGRVGERLRIVFSREETAPCSEHVVFPAFGRSAMLPPFEDVAFDVVPEHEGEYEFTCQLGLLRGRLVVTAGSRGSVTGSAADRPPSKEAERPGIERRRRLAEALRGGIHALLRDASSGNPHRRDRDPGGPPLAARGDRTGKYPYGV